MRRLAFKLSSRVAVPFQFLILPLCAVKKTPHGARGAGREGDRRRPLLPSAPRGIFMTLHGTEPDLNAGRHTAGRLTDRAPGPKPSGARAGARPSTAPPPAGLSPPASVARR